MPINLERIQRGFQRLDRQLSRLAKKAAPENVHKFRTSSRRVETVLDDLAPRTDRNAEKLSKLLARIRKKAGRLRDLDIQIASLRGLKGPEANGQRSKLLQSLLEERAQREKKLVKALDNKTTAQIHKRLKRAASKLALSRSIDPLAVALNKLAQLGRDHVPLTEKTLHQYRIIGKRARYIAELSANQPGAALVVEQLKRMQDVIGDWHDWLELGDRAEKLLGSVKDSALVAMLRNVTRAKFRQGADALVEARTALSGKRVGLVSIPAVPSRKPLAEHGTETTTAVA